MDLSIGIAAGGRSVRFGSDKRNALYQGKSFLTLSYEHFASFCDVILSVDTLDAASFLRDKPVTIVEDIESGIGPIEALARILSTAKNDYVFLVSVDMPLVDSRVALYLKAFLKDNVDVVCPVSHGQIQPLSAIYHKRVEKEIEEMKKCGVYRLRSLLDQVRTVYVDFADSGIDEKVFWNVNTQEEYRRLVEAKTLMDGRDDAGGKR